MKFVPFLILVIILYAVYTVLQPSETIILKGLEKTVRTEAYEVRVESKGEPFVMDGVRTLGRPPYTFDLRIMPKNPAVKFVELGTVHVYACGTTTKLFPHAQPLMHTVEYYDYKLPLALYKLNGSIRCHENVIMDLSFTLRDANQLPISSSTERLLVEAYERVPTTFGYWWEHAW
jgi:hypothetical protein